MTRYEALVDRLVRKMQLSQTPVPGFIMGLSGTDSILTFCLLYDACQAMGIPDRLRGIHYVSSLGDVRDEARWFVKHIFPWLKQRCSNAYLQIEVPLGGNQDQQRWADLHLRSLNAVGRDGEKTLVAPLNNALTPTGGEDRGFNYWVAGTINATEMYLGTYSVLATAVSIQPLQKVYKTAVLEMCRELGVPEIALEYSRQPDCWCGRDEIAAENIELIDAIIAMKVVPGDHDPELLNTLYAYIRDTKRDNDFKTRIPYVL